MTDSKQPTKEQISRRAFLQRMSAAAAGLISLSAAGCQVIEQEEFGGIVGLRLPTEEQYPEVPFCVLPGERVALRFFTRHEADTVVALTSRILPGTPEDPGAREAGVVFYIDNMLFHTFVEATYRQPPFAQAFEGDEPPDETEQGEFGVIWVPAGEIERYGYQSTLTSPEVYRLGVEYVDRYAREKFGAVYVELTEEQQDSIIADMLSDSATGFERFTPSTFFHVLRRHTSEGMFGDPCYGGNRDMIGWKLVGYPGAQRAYTPLEIVAADPPPRPPQSLDMMRHFHPGQPVTGQPVLPVRGSTIGNRESGVGSSE